MAAVFNPDTLRELRDEARRLYDEKGHPVSANDVRPVLDQIGYTGDKRILGQVFHRSEWEMVGSEPTTTEGHELFGSRRQHIGLYVPRQK